MDLWRRGLRSSTSLEGPRGFRSVLYIFVQHMLHIIQIYVYIYIYTYMYHIDWFDWFGWLIDSFIHSFIHSLFHWFTHSFICSFIHSIPLQLIACNFLSFYFRSFHSFFLSSIVSSTVFHSFYFISFHSFCFINFILFMSFHVCIHFIHVMSFHLM